MDDPTYVAFIVLVGWIFSVCFHEFGHAITAYAGGDTSVKSKGYLNFNPFAYTDIRLSIILPTVFVLLGGIGLPGASVRIRDDQLRARWWSSLVSAAGPLFTLLFSLALVAVIKSGAFQDLDLFALCWLLNIEFVVLILNLLPIPGLDGFGIIEPFMSQAMRQRMQPFYRYGFAIILFLIWVVPGPNNMLWDAAQKGMDFFGINQTLVYKGQHLYNAGAKPLAFVAIALAAIVYAINKKSDWLTAAETQMRAENYKECLELTEKAIAKNPKEARAYKMRGLCYAGLASEAAKEESASQQNIDFKKEAIDSIEKCIALEPTLCEHWLAKGIIYEQFADLTNAMLCFEKSLQLNKEFSYAFARYCSVLFNAKKYNEVLAACEKRLANMPEDSEALFQKAAALASLNSLEEALELFEKCIARGVHRDLSRKNKDIITAQLANKSNP